MGVGRTGTYGHLSEIAPKDAGDVMGGVVFGLPVEGFSVLDLCERERRGGERRVRTRGGISNAAWSSRMRLAEPFTRNVPSTSVAARAGGG